jgi:hypothetical protein
MRAAGLGPDFTGIPAVVLEAARQRGVFIHTMIDRRLKGLPVTIPLSVRGYWAAFERFTAEAPFQSTASEVTVEHAGWGYVGHLDDVGWMKSKRVLLDWKTTATLDVNAAAVQTAAYRLAWEAMRPVERIHACGAVQLRPDGRYKLVWLDVDAATPVWQAALVLYHWRVKTGRLAPGLIEI